MIFFPGRGGGVRGIILFSGGGGGGEVRDARDLELLFIYA